MSLILILLAVSCGSALTLAAAALPRCAAPAAARPEESTARDNDEGLRRDYIADIVAMVESRLDEPLDVTGEIEGRRTAGAAPHR